jgi:hypothetical protein
LSNPKFTQLFEIKTSNVHDTQCFCNPRKVSPNPEWQGRSKSITRPPSILLSVVPYAPTCNQAEEEIAAAWRQVFSQKISIHDNFFEIGGHSLLVVQVHHLLCSDYPSLKIVDLFTYPSIHSLANYLLE